MKQVQSVLENARDGNSRTWSVSWNCSVGARRLLVVESVIPPGNEPFFGKLLDVAMMVIPGGQERTEEEYRDQFGKVGGNVDPIARPHLDDSTLESQLDGSVQQDDPLRLRLVVPESWGRSAPLGHDPLGTGRDKRRHKLVGQIVRNAGEETLRSDHRSHRSRTAGIISRDQPLARGKESPRCGCLGSKRRTDGRPGKRVAARAVSSRPSPS